MRYGLAKAEGVAEVASVGGFVKQYNVVVDPQRLRASASRCDKVRDAIRASNIDVGGRTRRAVRVRIRGARPRLSAAASTISSKIVLKTDSGTPVLLRDVARVELGPDERRGITELNGEGEVASGIVAAALRRTTRSTSSTTSRSASPRSPPSLPQGRRRSCRSMTART